MWGVKFVLLYFMFLFGFKHVSAKTCYGAIFSEDVKDCKDFENTFLDANGLKIQDDGGLGIGGVLILYLPIEDGFEISAEAWKMTEIGREMVFSTSGEPCEKLNETDAPWSGIVTAMNATKCPIEAKTYSVVQILVNLGFAKDVMCHQFIGEYVITLKILKGGEVLSCHELGVEIYEYEVDDDKCP